MNKIKINNSLRILIISSILLCLASNLYSQESKDSIRTKRLYDTVCYMLKFNPGDTLIYKVESRDSVIIDYAKPLLKSRTEKIQLTCDSVVNGHYFLQQILIDYISYESNNDIKELKKTESTWLNRIVWFEIDSVGNRYSYWYNDSINAALTPGGAFQTTIIFPFQQNCKEVNKTWFVESLDELPENGFPVPLVQQSSLFRAIGPIDTLDEHCYRIQYIKTAQGSYQIIAENESYRVTNVIAGFGNYDISSEKHIPIHYMSSSEQKLTIKINDSQPKSGKHYTNTFYTLLEYKPGKDLKSEE